MAVRSNPKPTVVIAGSYDDDNGRSANPVISRVETACNRIIGIRLEGVMK